MKLNERERESESRETDRWWKRRKKQVLCKKGRMLAEWDRQRQHNRFYTKICVFCNLCLESEGERAKGIRGEWMKEQHILKHAIDG